MSTYDQIGFDYFPRTRLHAIVFASRYVVDVVVQDEGDIAIEHTLLHTSAIFQRIHVGEQVVATLDYGDILILWSIRVRTLSLIGRTDKLTG